MANATKFPLEDQVNEADLAYLSASALVAGGRLEEAEALLAPGGQLPSSPAALDLLARIAVHSGDLQQARKLWEAAIQADASYTPAQQALHALGTPWFPIAVAKRVGLLLLAALVACFAIVGALALLHPGPSTGPAATPRTAKSPRSDPNPAAAVPQHIPAEAAPSAPTTASADALKSVKQTLESQTAQLASQIHTLQSTQALLLAGQARLAEQLADAVASNQALLAKQQASSELLQAKLQEGQDNVRQQLTPLAASSQALSTQQTASFELIQQTRHDLVTLAKTYARDHQPATNPPPLPIRVAGATVRSLGGGWEIRFDPPLFDRDTHFKPGSKELLDAVAKALVQTQAKLNVQVVGLASQEPPVWPWSKPQSDGQLGLSRALRVNLHIQRLGIFPPDTLTAVAGSAADLPFPPQSRQNRTVVLRVSPAQPWNTSQSQR